MKEYLFVYNANSGLANAMIDYGKKYLMPSKYDCELCQLTYGPFGMKRDWKKFVNSLDSSVRFLHRDEFEKEFPNCDFALPAMLAHNEDQLTLMIDQEQFNQLETLEQLIEAVQNVT